MVSDQEQGKGKLHQTLAEYDTRLKIGTIARNEKDKDYGAAAKGYESFARDSQNRESAEKAYASAIADYVRAGEEVSAERVSSAWLARYPKSPKALESLRAAATQQLIQGRFEIALLRH